MTKLDEVKYYWDEELTKLKKHCFYKNGKLEGEYKCWYNNGQICEHCFYKNGKLEGEYKGWHDDGQLCEQYLYKNGEKIDLCNKPNIFNIILE